MRDYINVLMNFWLPDASALIKTAWWAKWTQADKRTGSIWWAHGLLMKKTLLPSFSTDMSALGEQWLEDPAVNKAVSKQKHWSWWKQTTHCGGQEHADDTFLSVTFYQIYSTLNLLSFFPDIFSFKDVYLVVICN